LGEEKSLRARMERLKQLVVAGGAILIPDHFLPALGEGRGAAAGARGAAGKQDEESAGNGEEQAWVREFHE
jgi:hypothetical protein